MPKPRSSDMRLSRDRAGRGGRAATIVVIGAVGLLAAAWATPRSSQAVAGWLRVDTVTSRTITMGDRLPVAPAPGAASPDDASSAATGPTPLETPGARATDLAPVSYTHLT